MAAERSPESREAGASRTAAKRGPVRALLFALAAAAVLTMIAAFGWLYRPDNALSDALYQRTGLQCPDIVVIGIDADTVEALGPVTGLRGAMADVIDRLSADPANAPAVIAVDLMYTGENRDAPEADARLAAAAQRAGCVVVGADAVYGPELIPQGGSFAIEQRRVLGWHEPYPALAQAASFGHLNQMLDRDGVFRHAQLWADVPDKGRIPSFARVIYERWCAAQGTSPDPEHAVSESGFYYLPFSQGTRGYSDGVNFLDLYEGRVPAQLLRGRIVMIGPYAAGMQDEYPVSLDHAVKMPGVVIQANIVEAFLNGFFPKEAGRTLQLILLFVICLAAALFFRDRKVLPSVLGWLGLCAAWISICVLAYRRGVVLHVLWVPAAVTALFIVSVALNYIRSARERRRVVDTFGHYIDPVIRDRLLAQGPGALKLGGETRDIAVLFVDVRGFTAMSEALDAQTVVEIVNRYLTLTTDCILRHHGTLDKFVGDCTMAVWNAPLEQDDPVLLACQAALDMVAGSEALGRELQERFGRTVSFGIGINWGPAVVGNIGAPRRLDYTAIGDTVNTASRLEANAPGGTILLSRAAADRLGDRARVTSLGDSIRLKGKAAGFEVLRLDGLTQPE